MYRVFPDRSTKAFAVPKEKVFVVTDFNVRGYLPSGSGNSRSAMHTIFRLTSSPKVSDTVVYRSSFHLTNDLDATGFTINGDMRGGIAVGTGRALCPAMEMDDGSQNVELLIVTGAIYAAT